MIDRKLHPAVGLIQQVSPLAIPEVLDAILRLAIPRAKLRTARHLGMFLAAWEERTCGYSRLQEQLPTARLRQIERMRNIHGNRPGEASRYRARGLAMQRGRKAYRALGNWIGIPLENVPERLEEPELAVLSGVWLWERHRCNSAFIHPLRIEITTMGRIDKKMLAYYNECAIFIEHKYSDLFEK